MKAYLRKKSFFLETYFKESDVIFRFLHYLNKSSPIFRVIVGFETVLESHKVISYLSCFLNHLSLRFLIRFPDASPLCQHRLVSSLENPSECILVLTKDTLNLEERKLVKSRLKFSFSFAYQGPQAAAEVAGGLAVQHQNAYSLFLKVYATLLISEQSPLLIQGYNTAHKVQDTDSYCICL